MITGTRLLAIALLVLALGLDRTTVARNVPYLASYAPISGTMTGPFTGDMLLTFNRGSISGNYSDTSHLAQAPLHGQKNATVIGSIDTESNFTLHIGHDISVQGRVTGERMTGILIWNGRKYNFRANPKS